MAVIFWGIGLWLLLLQAGCLASVEEIGCRKWNVKDGVVYCEACHAGNRMISESGSNPKDLCQPCEPDTFTQEPKALTCKSCTQCVGAQVLHTPCTARTDTVCTCRQGLTCGNKQCSFCVKSCGIGEEPTKNRSCRPCPEGTFNNVPNKECKPRKTKCPRSDQYIISKGDAFSDIVCGNLSVSATHNPSPPVPTKEQAWPLIIAVVTSVALTSVCIFVIATAAVKILKKKQEKTKEVVKEEVTITKELIIRRPTDEPMTLRAVECSFHEAQQEQGSSSESLNSKGSEEPLIV